MKIQRKYSDEPSEVMTVSQLIKELQKFDGDMPVLISGVHRSCIVEEVTTDNVVFVDDTNNGDFVQSDYAYENSTHFNILSKPIDAVIIVSYV